MPERKTYLVKRAERPIVPDADWEKSAWRQTKAGRIEQCMGPLPEHFPEARFRMLYDREHIYVIFRVEDRFVRAAGKRDEDPVWQDSCAEFFFTPGEDLAAGYFNFETNCLGARLWHHQFDRSAHTKLSPEDLARVAMAHSLANFEGELPGPLTWTLEYRVPFEILEHYIKVKRPSSGVRWRGNFQKCADLSSHPHWLTWSPIERPKPDFHVPEWFGYLEFE